MTKVLGLKFCGQGEGGGGGSNAVEGGEISLKNKC